MFTFVLGGVLGSVLTVGEAGAFTEQAKQLPAGGSGPAEALHVMVQEPVGASKPYARLFRIPAGSGETAGTQGVTGVGQKQTPNVIVDSSVDGPCRPAGPAVHRDIDTGIFVPPRDPRINFTIKRIVPKGCMDQGILIPKRQK